MALCPRVSLPGGWGGEHKDQTAPPPGGGLGAESVSRKMVPPRPLTATPTAGQLSAVPSSRPGPGRCGDGRTVRSGAPGEARPPTRLSPA